MYICNVDSNAVLSCNGVQRAAAVTAIMVLIAVIARRAVATNITVIQNGKRKKKSIRPDRLYLIGSNTALVG